MLDKSPKEKKLFEKYKPFLYSSGKIPPKVLFDFNEDIKRIKKAIKKN